MVLIKSNKLYDILKWIAQVLLPASGAAYFGLAEIWGLPNADKVVGTIVVIDTLLGVLLGLSSRAYNNSEARFDGQINVEEREDGGKTASMVVDEDPEVALKKDELTFKVNKGEAVATGEVTPKRQRNKRGQFTK